MPPSVVVLGGGIAGMSVAQELAERGFKVSVFEARDVPGGKARSVVVSSTIPRANVGTVHLGRLAASARLDLPGEHGFRFFPRFYKHIIDTMGRIPFRANRSVVDNLVSTSGTIFARFGKPALEWPTTTPRTVPELHALATDLAGIFGSDLGVSPDEFAFFGERIWQILTSCAERRQAEYEKIGWWEFIGAESRSDAYQKLFGIGCTRSVVAAQAKLASTKTIGDMFVQYFFNLAEPTVSADRVLNGPTNDVFIDPWLRYLRSLGVEYHLNARVESIECGSDGRISNVTVEHDRGLRQVSGDYYVAALPIDVMANLVTDQIVRADPSLASIFPLSKNTAWMSGIQFYLSEDVRIGRGHEIYLDAPWALTSISQQQFWADLDLRRFGNGDIRGVLSAVISDWDTPGLNGKPARDCTRHEIRDDVWEQLKRSLNVAPTPVLQDEDVRMWYLDLDVDPLFKSNSEPLLVNLIDSWHLRPKADTAIPNLLLAADYVQTYTDLACMEGANEAARRAVNAILTRSGVDASPCRIWDLHEPELLEPWRANDRARFMQGLPWDDSFMRLALSALAALQRGATVLEAAIHDAVRSAMHVDDLVGYLRTGESRSAFMERLSAGGDEGATELLRAFGALAQMPGGKNAEVVASSAVEALSAGTSDMLGDVRFVER